MAQSKLVPIPDNDLVPIPDDEEEEVKPKRQIVAGQDVTGRDREAYGRQQFAGFTDFITGLPALPGFIGAGIETLGRAAFTDDDIITSFNKSIASGIDKDLLDLAGKGRHWVNKQLNIPDPISKLEMAARLSTLAIPNPLSFGRLATLGINLATPLVKVVPRVGETVANALVKQGNIGALKALVTQPGQFVTKGNIGRLGLQVGIGTAFDQGARKLAGAPTLFSDIPSPISSAEAAELVPIPDELVPIPDTEAIKYDKLKEEENERNATKGTWAVALGLATIAALAWRRRVNNIKNFPSAYAPQGQGRRPEQFHETAGEYVHGNTVDSLSHVRAVLRNVKDPEGNQLIPESNIDQLLGDASGDSIGMTARVGKDGILPAAGNNAAIQIPKLQQLANDLVALGPERNKIFLDGMLARREKVQRIRSTIAAVARADPENITAARLAERGTATQAEDYLRSINRELDKTGLYDNAYKGATEPPTPKSNPDVDAAIHAMESDAALAKIAGDYGKITKGMLRFAVQRKVITPELAKQWLRQFRLHGSTIYIPGRELNVADLGNWYERLGAMFGMGTTKQRELQGVSEWQSQIASPGTGIKTPLNPIDALGEYMYHIIDHTDRSVAEWNVLSQLTGIDDLGKLKPGHPGSKAVTFLGIHDPSGPDAGNYIKAITNRDPGIRKIFGTEDRTRFLQHDSNTMNKVIFVQRHGKEYMFYVPDDTMRTVMQFKPQVLGNINKVGRAFKMVFQGTTTRLPFFTPISFAYTTQQAWSNAVARGAKFTPIDAFKGAWRGIADGISEEIAIQIGHSLRMETGLASKFPAIAKALERRMKTVVENSLLNDIQRTQGTLGSSIAVSEFNPQHLDMIKLIAPTYRDGFAGISSLWRMYNIINKAVHEGPAAGAMLRQLDDISNPYMPPLTGKQLRAAGRSSKTLTGDVRRMGSSDLAVTFNAWVPFSGAMIQSWNSIGSALKHALKNNPARAMAAISLPMIPAVMEAVNNSLLGEEYNNYYWNVLTTEQRNNNIVWMLPGFPPEKAIMIPISPEWTLPRGIAIEMVDAMTGASQNMHMPQGERGPAGNAKENGAHFMAGLVRVFDIPVPPLIQALFAQAGFNLRMGPQYHNGEVQWPISVRELTQGERVSGDRGRSRYVDPAVDTEVEGVFRSLAGAVGATFLAVTEAFRQGSSVDIKTGLDMGLDTLMLSAQGQTKYLNPLWQRSPFHPSSFDEIADSNRIKQSGIDRLSDLVNILETQGTVFSLEDPVPFEGSSLNPTDDPVVKIAAKSLGAVKQGVAIHKKHISIQRKIIQELQSSATYEGRKVSVGERKDLLDKHELTIRGMQAKQNMMLQYYEDLITDMVNQELGLKKKHAIEFIFEDFKPLPNLGEGLIVKAPRRSLQTSQ